MNIQRLFINISSDWSHIETIINMARMMNHWYIKVVPVQYEKKKNVCNRMI